ncbi:NACHT domain-containing protein [Nostoc calcicola FACHB-3891]|nr:NACHT domain-containing protein [Nostoc calcicola FACHB-3891]
MVTIKEFILGQQTTTLVGNPARPKNERILLAAVKEEVTARLRQSLHNAVLINLGKESQPQQVKRPWDAEIKIGLKPAVPLPNTTTILEVFDSQEIAGKLLILGAPGSGKTTTQLELAQELIKRAEEQPDYPVPVLFNLSSWKDDRQSITDWLVAELKSKYGVSNKLAKDWIKDHQLLPMLDGLDELKPQRQELFIVAVNQFLKSKYRPLYLVICSRTEEYENLVKASTTYLILNGAICLHPLTNNQIYDYLITVNHLNLWQIINADLNLLKLVRTPLLLSVTILTYQEISIEHWQHLKSTKDRLEYLLDKYTQRMLVREFKGEAYTKPEQPDARQTQRWLTFLAQQLHQESQTEFFLENIQPSWLFNNHQKWLFLKLIGCYPKQKIKTVENINFSFKSIKSELEKSHKLYLNILNIITNFINAKKIPGLPIVFLIILPILMFFIPILVVISILETGPSIENKRLPNQGIHASAANASRGDHRP